MTSKSLSQSLHIMGIIKDTDNVRRVEEKYGYPLVGYSAWWDEDYRAMVYEKGQNQWRGVYPLKAEDFQIIEVKK